MSDTALLTSSARKARLNRRWDRRRLIWSVFVTVVLLHVAVAVVAGLIIVARQLVKPASTFERRDVRMPASEREQRMRTEAIDAMARKPAFADKLQALQPAAILLPELPKVSMDHMLPLEPAAILSEQVSAMNEHGMAGDGTGRDGSGGDAGTGSSVSFFGIQDIAKSVVIIVDTSDTMFVRSLGGEKHRFQFSQIKDEAAKLIRGMNPSSRFNVVIYEGGAMAFAAENVAATDTRKDEAAAWIRSLSEAPKASINTRPTQGPKLMEGGGTRLETGFRQAFRMKPDVIYLITDGQVTSPTGAIDPRIIDREIRETLRDLQASLETPARIHVIYYVTAVARPEEARRLRSIAASHHGQFLQMKAAEKPATTQPGE